jgi:hypothetical protein
MHTTPILANWGNNSFDCDHGGRFEKARTTKRTYHEIILVLVDMYYSSLYINIRDSTYDYHLLLSYPYLSIVQGTFRFLVTKT